MHQVKIEVNAEEGNAGIYNKDSKISIGTGVYVSAVAENGAAIGTANRGYIGDIIIGNGTRVAAKTYSVSGFRRCIHKKNVVK